MREKERPSPGRAFASDNWAGVHPEVLDAMAAANVGHVPSYGEDPFTLDAVARIRNELGGDPEVFLLFSGTGANVLCLQSMVRSHQAVICAETAHVYTSECGAAEKHIGCKLLTVASPHGKITVKGIREHLHHIGNEHHVQPRAISITQATEYGTVYTPDEIRVIADFAHSHSLLLHMDGARLFNAAAYLNVPLRAITSDVGVDALSFGGTKNGMVAGEAAVFFKRVLADDFEYRRMQGMQLSSKMRFIAAQYLALLHDGLWLRSARHANRMAQLLAGELAGIHGITLTQPVQANEVFAILPAAIVAGLQKQWPFHIWNESLSEARLITSFDTEESDITDFAEMVREALGSKEKQWT
ncbi:MAG TPA: low specificity L-threonine aldolase [Gemmatimonadaceae bacterium]|nr:low specificity L-threonine aldolase [Gemmatimonadaceae bacterium]